jgi:hypothetical protein
MLNVTGAESRRVFVPGALWAHLVNVCSESCTKSREDGPADSFQPLVLAHLRETMSSENPV